MSSCSSQQTTQPTNRPKPNTANTSTPTPINNRTPFSKRDATCDEILNSTNYLCWRRSFLQVMNGGNPEITNTCKKVSDFDNSDKVNLIDFIFWKKGIYIA